MSKRYHDMTVWARDRIVPQLNALGPPERLWLFKVYGWEILAKPYQDLALSVYQQAVDEENYELSYNQMCNAFNQAFRTKHWS